MATDRRLAERDEQPRLDTLPRRQAATAATLLVAGILLASLTEAVAGTVLSLGRADIIGDTYATPDEFAWLDVGYTALKLIGFAGRAVAAEPHRPAQAHGRERCGWGACLWARGRDGAARPLVACAPLQGFSGGALLVSGQAMLFWRFSATRQPLLQALFAMGAVVAPATVAPALQGWLIDTHPGPGSSSASCRCRSPPPACCSLAHRRPPARRRAPFDWLGLALVGVGAVLR